LRKSGTADQDPQLQLDALAVEGCLKIYKDVATGIKADRPQWQACLNDLRPGDTLITRCRRAGRDSATTYVDSLRSGRPHTKIIPTANRCTDLPSDAYRIRCEIHALDASDGGWSRVGLNGSAPGAVRLHVVDGVPLLRPAEQVFDAMLDGWRNQQLARNLTASTVEGRRAGQPIHARGLSALINALGIPATAGRAAAIRHHVLDMPAPVVATAFGYQHVTTTRLAAEAGTTWARYAGGEHRR
jgi:hypothetical protein